MPGPPPKNPRTRQRQNRVAGAAILPSEAESKKREVPPLPERDSRAEQWHPKVVEWWEAVWTSPMAAEYLGPDVRGGLYGLAELYQQRWTTPHRKELVAIMAEIRLQEVRFGLSPIDRRRLQWEVAKGEEAEERTKRRRKERKMARQRGKDPRKSLKLA